MQITDELKLWGLRWIISLLSLHLVELYLNYPSLSARVYQVYQEARVALGYRPVQLLRIFRALQTSRVHP